MNRKLAIALAAAVIFGACLLLWPHKQQPPPVLAPTASPTPSQVPLVAQRASLTPTPRATPSGPPQLLPRQQIVTMVTQEREREKGIWDSLLATPVSLYGKVVDEKSNPIPDADVEASFADQISGEGDATLHVKTDGGGLFHVSGHGLSVIIRVSKEGYYRLKQSNGVFTYSKAAGQIDPHPDASDPAIFMLRKVGKTEPLIAVRRNFRIGKTGAPVGVNLTTGDAGGGDIQVQAWTNDQGHQVNSNQPYDWRARITVPGGGLVQRAGDFAFEAPSNGYTNADEIDMPATLGPQWHSQAARDYFLKLANGTYARLEFRMVAGGDHFFKIRSFLNPSPGHRNLEYNPGQQPAAP